MAHQSRIQTLLHKIAHPVQVELPFSVPSPRVSQLRTKPRVIREHFHSPV